MTEIERALLGDRAAQERITERGELLGCAHCGESPKTRVKAKDRMVDLWVICFACGAEKHIQIEMLDTEFDELQKGIKKVIGLWNTRSPILTETQIALLKMAEKPRKFEEGTDHEC